MITRSQLDVDLPPPEVFGLPPKFDRWRDMQARAIMAAADSPKRFVLQAMPTGAGKSLVYVAQGVITGARTCILTSTKGLQSQLLADFAPSGLVDIRGMNSYPCLAAEEFGVTSHRDRAILTCEEGPCRSGANCDLKLGGCTYYDQYREAQAAELVVTNYSYWMNINKYGEGLGNFDLLVMDEGHDAFQVLANFLAVELDAPEIESVLGTKPLPPSAVIEDWRKWSGVHGNKLESRLETLKQQIEDNRENGGTGNMSGLLRESAAGRRLLGKLKSLSGMKGDWIYEHQGRRHRFDPVWPKDYAESCLFRGIKRVVIFSATIRPKTAEVLGIKPGLHDFNEYPSPFPVSRRPVYHVPTAQMNFRATDAHVRTMITRIDQIIRQRQDRKGLIHTTSFKRRDLLVQHSEYADIMMTNDSRNTRSTVERFKLADPPAVLVSPSMSTGYDFPHDDVRYIIIMKLPFPDTRPLIMQARAASDKDYTNYMTAQILVQECGRGMRAADDQCEIFILDDSIKWFLYRYKHFFPKWWTDSFIWASSIPKPMQLGVA